MTEETKRDVFEDAVFQTGKSLYTLHDTDYAEGILGGLRARYDAALPDNLPVIPKEVGEYIKRNKQGKSALRSALIAATDFHAADEEEADWIFYHSEAFARAWLLGVWRVEETGEIVKLEAEK